MKKILIEIEVDVEGTSLENCSDETIISELIDFPGLKYKIIPSPSSLKQGTKLYSKEQVGEIMQLVTANLLSKEIGGTDYLKKQAEILNNPTLIYSQREKLPDNTFKVVEHYFEQEYHHDLVKHRTAFEFYNWLKNNYSLPSGHSQEEIEKYIDYRRTQEQGSDYYFQLKRKEIESFLKFSSSLNSTSEKEQLGERKCEYCGVTDGIHKLDCSFMAKL